MNMMRDGSAGGWPARRLAGPSGGAVRRGWVAACAAAILLLVFMPAASRAATAHTQTLASRAAMARTQTLAPMDQSCVQPPAGLVNWWPGDGTPDDIVSGNNLTLSGGVYYTAGEVGQAFLFDGSSGSGQSGTTNVLTKLPFSIDAWVYPQLRSDAGPPRGKVEYPNNAVSNDNSGRSGNGFGVNVWTTGSAQYSELTVEYSVPTQFRVVPGVSFASGQWYYIAVVYTSGNVKTYVDGQLKDDFNFGQGTEFGVNYVRVGRHNEDPGWGTRRFFKGALDEVDVYDRALSAGEVQAIYNAGSAGKCKPAVPTLTVNPPSAIVGQTITLTGTDFGPTEPVNIYADNTGNAPLYATTTDMSGTFVLQTTVLRQLHGAHTLIAVGRRSGASASAPFVGQAGLRLNPSTATPGSVVGVTGYGFGALEGVNLYWDAPTGPLLRQDVSTRGGHLTTFFTVPTNAQAGTHLIYAIGQRTGTQGMATLTVQ